MGAIRATAAAVLILTAVAAAADCVTATRLISTRSSNPNLVAGPVAWSGSVLGVAKTQEGVANAIWFAVYGEDLQTLVGDRLVASDSREITELVWTGTEFGLFYRTNNQRLHLQRLSMMGDSIGAPIAITSNRTVYTGDEIDVEWSSALEAYVVARIISQGGFKGPWITIVNRDGTPRSDRQLTVFASPQSNLSLAVTDTGVIGMFFVNLNGTLSFARIGETGPSDVRAISQVPGDFIETAATGNYFVVVHSVANGLNTEIRWLVVDTSHQILRADQFFLQGSGANSWPLALISGNGELAMAYIDAPDSDDPLDKTYRLRRFTLDGTVLTDTRFAAADIGSARAESAYDFVWSGTSYLQAAFRESPDRLNSQLLRFCPLSAEIVTDRTVGRPNQPVVFTAVPQGGVPSYSYAWTFGDPERVFRTQVVSRTYDRTGTYTATLTVTDNAGAIVTTTYTINVVNAKRRSVRP
ncbi:MAG TPA: PKD domain-containing protein [Thermoanaerobaculia bacterium]|jgi:hypothetical protein|nr:PKD domain-containing protein [Thermoanaerobaculia bacterium]